MTPTAQTTLTTADQLERRIETRTANIGIIGLGYVGLPLALLFSEQKFRVTGFDIDQKKVETLGRGGSYIVRIPETEIQAAAAQGFNAISKSKNLSTMTVVSILVMCR